MKTVAIELFLKAFAEHGAAIKRLIAAAVIGAVTWLATTYFGVDAVTSARWAGGITLASGWLLDAIVAHVQKVNADKLQRTVNTVQSPLIPEIRVDGRAGPVTQEAVQKMAATINLLMADKSAAETKQIKTAVANEVSL